MQLIGVILALNILALTIFLLVKRCSPSLTLLSMGLVMFVLAWAFDIGGQRSGSDPNILYAMFDNLYGVFKSRLAEAGLLIMLFGGYIEYMKKINASDEMLFVFMRPLSVLRNYPYLAAIVVIPIGLIIYMAIPSATAMGLLLVATIYPVLLGIGLTRKSALGIISACTAFDMGVASFNSNAAADLLGMDIMQYFALQLKFLIPLGVMLIVSVYLTNKIMDRKENGTGIRPYSIKPDEWSGKAPVFYAVLPILPLVILLLLRDRSDVVRNIAIAIFASFIISGIADSIVKKSFVLGLREMNAFWSGLGRICSTAVVLMICADIFAQGLIHLGISDTLVMAVSQLKSGKFISLLVMGTATFLSTFMMGSGVSFFSAMLPSLPDVAQTLGISQIGLTMMMQLIAGFARTASPIAVVIITISEIAGVSPVDLVKRNLPPMIVLSLMLVVLTLLA